VAGKKCEEQEEPREDVAKIDEVDSWLFPSTLWRFVLQTALRHMANFYVAAFSFRNSRHPEAFEMLMSQFIWFRGLCSFSRSKHACLRIVSS